IIEKSTAPGKAPALVKPPRGLEALGVAGFEFERLDAVFARQRLDGIENENTDPLTPDFRKRVHALDLGLILGKHLERPHTHRPASLVACDKHRGIGTGHLLD